MGKGENIIYITGELTEPFKFDHSVKGEKFFTSMVKIERHSNEHDHIPVMVSEKMLNGVMGDKGWCASVIGQIRMVSGIRVLANSRIDLWENAFFNENDVSLVGKVQKIVNRKTPKGRVITELVLCVDRGYGKVDFIPCITWGDNANMAKELLEGEIVAVKGRLQSRNYVKPGQTKVRTTYEVSSSIIYRVKENEDEDKSLKS